jgi:ubiquinone/menaquinone biosynthesis C-methylase UbiE
MFRRAAAHTIVRRRLEGVITVTDTTADAAVTPTTPAGWQLDEARARDYERFLVAAVLDGWAADLVDLVAPAAGERVLDVGCGTGVVARHAAARVGPTGAVTGVDRNRGMLTVARELGADAQPPISWLEGDATDLPVAAVSIDVAVCQQALQFIADPAAALAELRRVTVPGGRVGLATCRSLAHQPGYAALIGAVARHLGDEVAGVLASVYALGDPDEVGRLVAAAGFADVHRRIELTTFRVPSAEALLTAETSSSPVGPVADLLDRPAYAALVADVETALAPHTDDEGIVFPFETLVVTARR